MGVVVLVAGLLAHDWSSWSGFWHKEAVLDRAIVQKWSVLSGLDAFTTKLNRGFERTGWLVAMVIIGSVQGGYAWLLEWKRKEIKNGKLGVFSKTCLKKVLMVEGLVLVMATFYFLFTTRLFKDLSRKIGSCSSEDSFAFPVWRDDCHGTFRGFDISGHCFLIVHSCLLVLEYLAKAWYIWSVDSNDRKAAESGKLEEKNSDLEDQMLVIEEKKFEEPKTDNYFSFLIGISVVGSLMIVGEMMIYMQTILFYHTVTEKLLGTLIGSAFWVILFALSIPYPHLF